MSFISIASSMPVSVLTLVSVETAIASASRSAVTILYRNGSVSLVAA